MLGDIGQGLLQKSVQANVNQVGQRGVGDIVRGVGNLDLGAAGELPAQAIQRWVQTGGIQGRWAQIAGDRAQHFHCLFGEADRFAHPVAQLSLFGQVAVQQLQPDLESGQGLPGFVVKLPRQPLALLFLRGHNLLSQHL